MDPAAPPPFEPRDPHDQRLVDQVRPANRPNPRPAARYQLVVLGAGPAGLVAAAGAAGLGAKVALVERDRLGGDCLNAGCVPSKALIRSARALAAVQEAAGFGVHVPPGATADFAAVMERLRRVRAELAVHDSVRRFTELGVDVFLGAGTFAGPDRVTVGGQTLRFGRAVIATGARAAVPPIPGLRDVPFLTNETLFSLTEQPARLGILGAGPIGCEMAQCFARLGSEVILIETAHGILSREERDAADLVAAAMQRDGVRVLCCGQDLRVSRDGAAIRLELRSHEEPHVVRVDQLLVATGRTPNVEGLGLEAAGVAHDERGVTVNDRLRTTAPRIYACGDVCSSLRHTHAADFMARAVLRNALFRGRVWVTSLVIPRVTFTAPEIASVGLSEAEAAARGVATDTFTQELASVDRAVLDGETDGFVRVRVRRGTDEIVGATVVAAHAGELIGEIALAMRGGIGLGTVADTIHPYPTRADAFRKIGDRFNRTRLTPRVRALMRRWLEWTV